MKTRTTLQVVALVGMIFVSLFVLIPVKAIVVMAHEFYDPLGSTESSSFEYMGRTIFEAPPSWSVTGGMRYLPADFNDDGRVDGSDMIVVSYAFGSKPGHPKWNANADLTGDNVVDGSDLIQLSKVFGKAKESLHGDRSWLIGGNGDWYMERNVSEYCIPALESNAFAFGFWLHCEKLYAANGSCRAEVSITYVDSTEKFEGVWVWRLPIPGWTAAYVNAYCYAGAQNIQVKIHGQDIKAFIDAATVSLFQTATYEGEYGSMGLLMSIFSYKKDVGMTLDGMVRAIPSLYAEAAAGYAIKWIELKVTRVPFEAGTYNLNIPYCQQANDQGYKVDPEAIDQQVADQLSVASIIVPIAVTSFFTFGIPAIVGSAAAGSTLGIGLRFGFSTTFGLALKFLLPFFASDCDHSTADGGGQGDAVWEHWPYPTVIESPLNRGSWFAVSSSGSYDLDWSFDTDTYHLFGITVEASVCFAEPVFHAGPIHDSWVLEDRQICTQQITILIGT